MNTVTTKNAHYTMYDRDTNLVEVEFSNDTWFVQLLDDDWDGNIDEVNEWVATEFNVIEEQLDWRDPNTLWIMEH